MIHVVRVKLEEWKGALVGVAATAVVILVAYNSIQGNQTINAVRDTQQTGSPVLTAISDQNEKIIAQGKVIKDLSQRIISCTDHSGKCFKEGVKGQADAIASINVITKWSAICAPLVSADQSLAVRVRIITVCFSQLAKTEGTP